MASLVQENFFLVFSIASSAKKKFCPTKLHRFIRFFSQKLCISIAFIDTFFSIDAHLWPRGFLLRVQWSVVEEKIK
jgi:hypothetical protein